MRDFLLMAFVGLVVAFAAYYAFGLPPLLADGAGFGAALVAVGIRGRRSRTGE